MRLLPLKFQKNQSRDIQYWTIEKTKSFSKNFVPFKSVNSIKNAKLSILPPNFSTKDPVAFAVPPVANKSSTEDKGAAT